MITGGTGYLGTRLCTELAGEGWRVIVASRNAKANRGHFSDQNHIALIDSEDRTNLAHAITNAAAGQPVKTLIHLAADTRSASGSEAAWNQLTSNVSSPTSLLEACLEQGLEQVINTGSFWQYAEGTDQSIPNSLYAATKSAFESILEHYRFNHGLRILTIELYDVYGPKDPRPKLLNMLTRSDLQSLDMTAGEQPIAPVYIDDAVAVYHKALQWLPTQISGSSHRYSARSPSAVTLRQLIAKLEAVVDAEGGTLPQIHWGAKDYRDEEIFSLKPANPLPGWQPKVSLEEGLRRMVQSQASEVLQ